MEGTAIFRGRGVACDTTGNSPRTKWVAFNAIAEHLDYGRRYTNRTIQVQRSFEDTALKQRLRAAASRARRHVAGRISIVPSHQPTMGGAGGRAA